MNRKTELDLRLRANAGRKRRQEITEKIMSVLGTTPEETFVIDLEQSDSIRNRSTALMNQVEHDGAGNETKVAIWQIVPSDAKQITLFPPRHESLYFLPIDVSQVGIFVISADAINRSWSELLEQERDGFEIMTPTLKSGVVVDRVREWPLWKDVIEIRAWGSETVEWLRQQNIVSILPKVETT